VARAQSAFAWALALSAPLFAVGMVLPMWPPAAAALARPALGGITSVGTVAKWALATPVQFGCGARFHTGAAAALRRRRQHGRAGQPGHQRRVLRIAAVAAALRGDGPRAARRLLRHERDGDRPSSCWASTWKLPPRAAPATRWRSC
jgi:hypothetical protein